MYLHIGKGTVIEKKGVVGIFDLDICSQSHLTRKYLTMAEKAGLVVNAAEDIPKSFVIFQDREKTSVYLSQRSAATLHKRAETGVL